MPRARVGSDCFFVNPLVGHRDFEKLKQATGPTWTKDIVNHAAHILVIKKRVYPRRAEFTMKHHDPNRTKHYMPPWGR